jgi:hypothetical protein
LAQSEYFPSKSISPGGSITHSRCTTWSRKYRSWLTHTIVPGKSRSVRSSASHWRCRGGSSARRARARSAVEQELGEPDAGPLAAAQHGDLLLDVLLAEQERGERVAELLLVERPVAEHLVHHGAVRVELVHPEPLVVVPDVQVRAPLGRPAVGRLLAEQHLKHRRLAGPVGADDPIRSPRRTSTFSTSHSVRPANPLASART